MFLFIKVLKLFVLPPGVFLVGLGVVLVLWWRSRATLARRVLILNLIFLWVLSTGAGAFLLSQGLERVGASAPAALTGKEEAIVVLAGGASKKQEEDPLLILSTASARRLLWALKLYEHSSARLPIVYTGGSSDPYDPETIEAATAKRFAVSRGIPEENFWVESRSRDTYENALAVRQMFDTRFPGKFPHRIVLVTSAIHMPRARLVMEALGFEVVSASAPEEPVQFRWNILEFLPQPHALSGSTVALNEWVGIAGYWFIGWL